MRVAALVHNAVLKDARVIKEAKTLRAAGYTVEIHGISPNGQDEHHVLPGTDISVFLAARRAEHPQFTTKVILRIVNAGIVISLSVIAALFYTSLFYFFRDIEVFHIFVLIFLPHCLLFFLLNKYYKSIMQKVKYLKDLGIKFIGYFKSNLVKQMQKTKLANAVDNYTFMAVADSLCRSVASRPAPSIIHFHDHVSLLAAKRLKAKYRVPIVWDAHEIYEDLASGDPVIGRRNAKIISQNHGVADGFVTINESIAAFYQKNYPCLPAATIIMNATLPMPLPDYDGRLHEAAGLNVSQKIVLFQGGLAKKRGLTHLVMAAAKLKPEWTVVMMGWGPLKDELQDLAAANPRKCGPPPVVFVPGVPQAELQMWSAGAALGAIPYELAGLNHLYCTPNKLWEYPSAGVPIICTDLEEMSALVKPNGIGYLLPREFTAEDITDTINNIDDADLAEKKLNCERFIAANNWDTYAHRLVTLYGRLRPISPTDHVMPKSAAIRAA